MALKRLIELVSKFTLFDTDYVTKTKKLAELLRDELEGRGVQYERFVYPVSAPEWSWHLEADGEEVRSLPAGLGTGEFHELRLSEVDVNDAPPEGSVTFMRGLAKTEIRTPLFSKGPAIAVSEVDAERLKSVKEVSWRLKTRAVETFGEAFLVGNLEKAEKAVVLHYDSLWAGAVDNASGVVAALELLERVDLDKVAFAFIGFAEVALGEEEYWLYSFNQVSSAYAELFENVKEVVVLDCLGTGKAGRIVEKEYVESYSPFGAEKLTIFGTPLRAMREYYHGTNDTPDKVLPKALREDIIAIERHLAQG